MAQGISWSREALDDIDQIAEFISRDSLQHARRVATALFELGDTIAMFPSAGRIVPELQDDTVRERFLYSYRIVYQTHADQVAILAVLHGRRLLESLGERFDIHE